MTPDAIDKAIQFLLEQQAAFEASLLKTQELLKEGSTRIQLQIEKTQTQIDELAKHTHANSEQIRAHGEYLKAGAEKDRQLSEEINALKDACRELLEHAGYTDFRLNRLENRER